MASIVRGILFVGVLIYTSLLYHSTALAHLGYAGALLLILACIVLGIRTLRMQCELQAPVTVAEQGQLFTVQFLVKGNGILPCSKLYFYLELSSSFSKRKKHRWLRGSTALPGENQYDFKLEFSDSGSYRLDLKKIRIYDLTGLFYVHKKINSGCKVQVFPEMHEIGVQLTERVRNFSQDADVYDDVRPGNDYSELFQVRPFQKGDKLRQIHWKLSVKMDELFVRQGSQPRPCPVIFLLDYCQKKQNSTREANAYLVIMASISFSMMDAGCPYYAAWYSNVHKDIMRIRVDDEDGLYFFFCTYLSDTFQDKEENLPDAYREKYRGEQYVSVITFNEKLELLKNGEQIEKFAGADWEKVLNRMELIL